MAPTVSAIITTHNRLNLLIRAIDSVRKQTYPNIEIIVVDDASSDGTRERLANETGLQYIYITPLESKGSNHARNIGLENAHGEYIAFLDDDDYWLPEKTQKQINLIEEKRCGLVYSGWIIESVNNGEISYFDSIQDPANSGDMSKRALYSPCCLTSMILISRQLISQMGKWDEKLGFWQDHDFLIRAAQQTPFFYVDKPLCVYRRDLDDRLRKSNIFWDWRKDMRYVHWKHRTLYNELPYNERLEARLLALNEAMRRSRTEGIKGVYLFYRIATAFLYSLPKKVTH